VVVLYPFGWALGLSLYKYYVLQGNPEFIGILNFIKLFTDDVIFWTTLKNTVIWVFGIVTAEYIVGFITATLLNQKFPGRILFRTLVLLPWVVPPVASSLTWKVIYDPFTGLLNWILQNLGFIENYVAFLSNPKTALMMCMLVRFWRGIPFVTVMLLAGLQSIDPELYESAEVDGANWFHKLIFITLPQMKTISLVVVLLRCIWTFNAFAEVFVLTQGGPGDATQLVSLLTYQTAFQWYKFGYASSIGTVMFLILLPPVVTYLREVRKSWR
jgi:ABC-type sugar transport system permease subunit